MTLDIANACLSPGVNSRTELVNLAIISVDITKNTPKFENIE
jgi:hypothetical protein